MNPCEGQWGRPVVQPCFSQPGWQSGGNITPAKSTLPLEEV